MCDIGVKIILSPLRTIIYKQMHTFLKMFLVIKTNQQNIHHLQERKIKKDVKMGGGGVNKITVNREKKIDWVGGNKEIVRKTTRMNIRNTEKERKLMAKLTTNCNGCSCGCSSKL